MLLLSSGYETPSLALFLVTIVRNFFSDLLPARLGTLIYIYLIRSRLNIPLAPAISSFAYSFIFDIISLALLLMPAILIISLGNQSSYILLAAGIGLGCTSIAVLFVLPKCSRITANICQSLRIIPQKWRMRIHDELIATEQYLLQTRKYGIYWKVLALSFGVRSCKYLCLYVLLLGLVASLGYTTLDFPLAKVFLVLCSAELAASLPISGIAGFGAYEGAWSLVFQLLGYPEKIAVLTGISHHLFTQVYGYSLGGLALLVLLLPFFKDDIPKTESNSLQNRTRYFWLKFVATSFFLIVAASLFFPSPEKTGEPKAEVFNSDKLQQGIDKQDKAAHSIAALPGKVVYQRPGGIYVTDLTTRQEKMLAERGTYPRWSADGRFIAYVLDQSIMLLDYKSGKSRELAQAADPRAVCFHSNKNAVLYTDGKFLRQVDIETLKVNDLLNDGRIREIDLNNSGEKLAVTVKTVFGFEVRIYEHPFLVGHVVARGCSASLSPDGKFVTVNSGDHTALYLYNSTSRQKSGQVSAPPGERFDNQFWSNHPDWIVATSEGNKKNIFIHNVKKGSYLQVTSGNDCDRGDLFIDRS